RRPAAVRAARDSGEKRPHRPRRAVAALPLDRHMVLLAQLRQRAAIALKAATRPSCSLGGFARRNTARIRETPSRTRNPPAVFHTRAEADAPFTHPPRPRPAPLSGHRPSAGPLGAEGHSVSSLAAAFAKAISGRPRVSGR